MKCINRPTLVLHEDGSNTIEMSVVNDTLEVYQYGDKHIYLNWQQLQELFDYAVEKWGEKEGKEVSND